MRFADDLKFTRHFDLSCSTFTPTTQLWRVINLFKGDHPGGERQGQRSGPNKHPETF